MSTLGKNIKFLRKKMGHNQKELAIVLGVSQTSIAHYEAGSRQPTIDTLSQISQLFDVSIDNLVGNNIKSDDNSSSKTITTEETIDSLVECLLKKDEKAFADLFEGTVFPNFKLNELLDQILKQVMYKIGDLWEKGLISEADEHYATNIVRKSLHYTQFNMNKALENRKAISLVVGSDKHSLGIEMVNTVLESEGVKPIYLGGDLPIRSVENAIKDNNPNFVFISVTIQDNINSLIQLVDSLNERFKEKIEICIGGQGVLKTNNLLLRKNVHLMRDIEDVRNFIFSN